MKRIGIISIALGLTLFITLACVKDRDYEPPQLDCISSGQVNASYEEVKALYRGTTEEILEDLVIEGYVISSDKAGNFFGSLHFQDLPVAPSGGFQLEMDLMDSHLFFPPGTHILLKLKGLYLGKGAGGFKLGGVFPAFGNIAVGRLPAAAVQEHLFTACEPGTALEARPVTLSGLEEGMVNTLLRLEGLELAETSIGQAFAPPKEEAVHELRDCEGHSMELLNSGYADFQGDLLPEGRGAISGVLTQDRQKFQLIIRDPTDIDFQLERCDAGGTATGSNKVFISELADPDNNPDARFVELYHAGTQVLSMDQWTLRRYTNASGEVSSVLDLSGLRMAPNSTLVLASDAVVFETVYGFAPDLDAGTNGPADSNGDDNLELVDPFGTVIDLFGLVGEDGSGTNHEFEDGRAVRRPTVTTGNPVYTFSEWDIYNDTGAAETQNLPQQAPADFSPGTH